MLSRVDCMKETTLFYEMFSLFLSPVPPPGPLPILLRSNFSFHIMDFQNYFLTIFLYTKTSRKKDPEATVKKI